jgi:8-oxo-dGTP pyrophosphatase MutT (NUDIX family)
MRGRTALEAAMIEAYEEAGIVGHAVSPTPIGSYRYRKLLRSGREAELRVRVFLVVVDDLLEDWPERGERVVAWFDPLQAAAAVAEPALAKLIRRLPRTLAGTGLASAARTG